MKLFRFFLAMVVAMTLFSSCHNGNGNEEGAIDLPAIQQKGELTVLTLNSSTSYFSYRGEPMGFQYELAQQFAASLGVKLNIKVVKNVKAMTDSLLAGKGDLIAFNLTISNALKDCVIYCGEENITHQVLVQRKSKSAITDVTQLIGKEVYATPGAHLARLRNLNDELGGGINVKEISADSVSVEELISWVADGKIDYTLATEEVAKLNRTYYPNLNVSCVHRGRCVRLRHCWRRQPTSGTRKISIRRNSRSAPNVILNSTSIRIVRLYCRLKTERYRITTICSVSTLHVWGGTGVCLLRYVSQSLTSTPT